MIAILANRSEQFKRLADETMLLLQAYIQETPALPTVFGLISTHIAQSIYSARLLEVAMHSLLQVLEERAYLEGRLLPLCQMRTANKKHRNIGDIEIVNGAESSIVIEAWDAKFGKPYLRDELEELIEKLEDKPFVSVVGFVVDTEPDLRLEIQDRVEEIEEITGTEVKILSLWGWVQYRIEKAGVKADEISGEWLRAYVESLCQCRREQAPIDEPSDQWVETLRDRIKQAMQA